MKKTVTILICALYCILNISKLAACPLGNLGVCIFPCVDSVQDQSKLVVARGFRPPKVIPKVMPKSGTQKPQTGGKTPPKGSHDKNKRESNRDDHEYADARRQREQEKARDKKENNKKNNMSTYGNNPSR